MLRIAIDGACRNNGKPNCVAAGGLFTILHDADSKATYYTSSTFAKPSTSQRGELMALMLALDEVLYHNMDAQIITDSEYIFNSMTKEWYVGWESRGWLTSLQEPVKNVDLWKGIVKAIRECHARNIDAIFYHIKGHCLPFGKVTAAKLLENDPSGLTIFDGVRTKFDELLASGALSKIETAQDLSDKNNGFKLSAEALKDFITMNTVADAVATKCVEAASLLVD